MSTLTKMFRSWYLRRRITYHDTPLESYARQLERGEPYTFVRYGDGEWQALLGDPGGNADHHRYFPELGRDLRRTLEDARPYLYGMQPSVMKWDGVRIGKYLARAQADIPWHNANVFHYANRDGRLFPLVRALRAHENVLIGPGHLRALGNRIFPVSHFIEIPAIDCYLTMDETRRAILEHARGRTGVVYGFAASMMTKVLAHDLYPELGAENWLLDFGSLWDVYAGVQSRSVYRDLDWTPIIAKNLGT